MNKNKNFYLFIRLFTLSLILFLSSTLNAILVIIELPFKNTFYYMKKLNFLTLIAVAFSLLGLSQLSAQQDPSQPVTVQDPGNSEGPFGLNKDHKEYSLELIPLEGNHVTPEKCKKIDAQTIHLQKGQKLTVKLNKKKLFYQQDGKFCFGTNYDVQSDLVIRNWNGWENWVAGSAPVTELGFKESDFCNSYFYHAASHGGEATLSFISITYPRYYSSLRVIVDEAPETGMSR